MNVYVRELTRVLGRLNVHVDVYTRSQDEHVPQVVHDLGYGNRVVHIPAGPEIPLAKPELAIHIPNFVQRIIDFTDKKKLKYDIIHSHYWMSGIAARALKLAWNIPVIHMFHTLGLMKNRIARKNEFEGDYRIQGERDVIKIVDKIIAATLAELAQLQWLYEVNSNHIKIVPPGVDICHFYPIPTDEAKEYLGINQNDRMLLFVGRIEPLKGIDTLIRALAKMRSLGFLDNHNIVLSIIGGDVEDGSEEMSAETSRLHSLRSELGLQDLITFLGKLGQDVLPYYYSAADVMIVPSHYESFGMVALEAMACGTPVVASQVGGLAFLIQDGVTGYHIPSRDPEALSERLITLLQDRELHTSMSLQAAAYAKKYAWKEIGTQILDVYHDVLEGREPTQLREFNHITASQFE
jgi:D-inositol-3-phosphate glycosyltransferase